MMFLLEWSINQSLLASLGGDRCPSVCFDGELGELGATDLMLYMNTVATKRTIAMIEAPMITLVSFWAMMRPKTTRILPMLVTTTANWRCKGLKVMPLKRVVAPMMCWMVRTTRKMQPILNQPYLQQCAPAWEDSTRRSVRDGGIPWWWLQPRRRWWRSQLWWRTTHARPLKSCGLVCR